MSHSRTHRTKLARRVAREAGIGYQAALRQVDDADAQGILTRTLDEAGMAAAVRRLTASGALVAAEPVSGELQDLAALLENAGFEAVVMPGTKELRAHVRVIDPRNEVVEYLIGIGDPPGTSDPAEDGVYGVALRNTLIASGGVWDVEGPLPRHPTTPREAVRAFVNWLDAPGAPSHKVLDDCDREQLFTALEQAAWLQSTDDPLASDPEFAEVYPALTRLRDRLADELGEAWVDDRTPVTLNSFDCLVAAAAASLAARYFDAMADNLTADGNLGAVRMLRYRAEDMKTLSGQLQRTGWQT